MTIAVVVIDRVGSDDWRLRDTCEDMMNVVHGSPHMQHILDG